MGRTVIRQIVLSIVISNGSCSYYYYCCYGALFLCIAAEPASDILGTFSGIIRYEIFPANQSLKESSQVTKQTSWSFMLYEGGPFIPQRFVVTNIQISGCSLHVVTAYAHCFLLVGLSQFKNCISKCQEPSYRKSLRLELKDPLSSSLTLSLSLCPRNGDDCTCATCLRTKGDAVSRRR